MKTIFRFDFEKKAIVGSKRSIERANKGLSPEYGALVKMLKEQPTFEVKVKNSDSNSTEKKKKTYKRLTFERMEMYMNCLSNSEELLDEYNHVKTVAEAKGAKYPLTKKWFLTKFPEYKDSECVVDDQLNDTRAGEEAA